MIVAPLLEGREAVGVLKVLSERPHVFGDQDVETLQILAGFIATAIANAQRFEAQAHHALYDALTGLPNRRLLLERLEHALRARPPWTAALALLFVDLDGFKALNDRLGHAAGDRLLVSFAAHVAEVVRLGDTVARLGGDEFVVLCENVARSQVDSIVERVGDAAVRSSCDAPISASIGVALTDAPVPADVLLARADAAMYARKRSRRR
jgi:diguanylate cyclase (GGDEF)-like protein